MNGCPHCGRRHCACLREASPAAPAVAAPACVCAPTRGGDMRDCRLSNFTIGGEVTADCACSCHAPPLPLDALHAEGEARPCPTCGNNDLARIDRVEAAQEGAIAELEAALTDARAQLEELRRIKDVAENMAIEKAAERDALAARLDAAVKALEAAEKFADAIGREYGCDREGEEAENHLGENDDPSDCWYCWALMVKESARAALAAARAGEGG